MGFKDIFKSEVTCAYCLNIIPKREAGDFDTTHQGKNKVGSNIKLCQECMRNLLFDNLRHFNDKLVIFSPIASYNAIVAYDFSFLLRVNKNKGLIALENEDFVNELKAILPKDDTKCVECGNKATMTWCPSELINNDPYSWKLVENDTFSVQCLCQTCLIEKLRGSLVDKEYLIKTIYPPLSGDGFLCSWSI